MPVKDGRIVQRDEKLPIRDILHTTHLKKLCCEVGFL